MRGAALFVLGSLVFSLMLGIAKLVGEQLHVTEVLFFRQVVMVLVAVPIMAGNWRACLRSSRPKLQFLRIVLAFSSIVLAFGAVMNLGLAEVTLLSFSKSYFLTILAIVFLGERVGMARWSALFIGFAGVLVVMSHGRIEGGATIWHLAAVASALCVAAVMIIIRVLARIDRPVTIMTYQAVGVGLLLAPGMLWFWQTPTLEQWGLIGLIGLLSAAAQYCNILAFRVAEASALAPLEYIRLIFAAAIGFWLFGEWPHAEVWIGATIIIGGALYMLQRERANAQRGRASPIAQPGE